jgi:hypothetical protein
MQKKPIFKMEGVKVQWANIMDAEFAKEWPGEVEHEPMGLTRHIAKKPEYKARMTVLDAKPHLIERAYARGEISAEEAMVEKSDAEVGDEARKATTKAAGVLAAEKRKELVEQLTRQVVKGLKAPPLKPIKTHKVLCARGQQRARDKRRNMEQLAAAGAAGIPAAGAETNNYA